MSLKILQINVKNPKIYGFILLIVERVVIAELVKQLQTFCVMQYLFLLRGIVINIDIIINTAFMLKNFSTVTCT